MILLTSAKWGQRHLFHLAKWSWNENKGRCSANSSFSSEYSPFHLYDLDNWLSKETPRRSSSPVCLLSLLCCASWSVMSNSAIPWIVSSVHGILQVRILDWVAIPFSRGASQPRDWKKLSLLHCRQILYYLSCKACPPTQSIFVVV